MILNYHKSIFIIILLITLNPIYSINKPKIRTGLTSNGFYKLSKSKEEQSLYPSKLYDKLFFSIEEKLSDFLKYRYKVDFYTYDYNKYNSNLENLKSIAFYNTIDLFLIFSKNEIKTSTKPMVYYKYGEIYLKLMNKLQYKLDLKNFSFKTYYSHLYTFKDNELFYHNISIAFFWSLPEKDFMKFKTEINVYLQHYIENFQDTTKNISPLKSVKFNFELAVDFNKIKFEEVFKNDENEDNFFDEKDD